VRDRLEGCELVDVEDGVATSVESLGSLSTGICRVVITWVTSLEKNFSSL